LGIAGARIAFAAAPPPANRSDLPAATAAPPPMPPLSKSPVEVFRELLLMTPGARIQALTNRPPEVQQRILVKLREYAALQPDERELRLRVTELRWYVLPLLSAPPESRAAQLERIPADLRKLIESRLTQWNILPPPLQKQVLDDDQTMNLYLQLEASTTAQRENLLKNLPAGRREEVEGGFRQWVQLSEAERRKLVEHVYRFFELTPREKDKVLATLSEPERRQMESTLASFANLPPAQRVQCIRSFGKFASLNPEDRNQFLKNAERWQAMTPEERQTWRNLVNSTALMPPLPTGLGAPPMPSPAPRRTAGAPAPPVATNGN
jgi:hypothetical protein